MSRRLLLPKPALSKSDLTRCFGCAQPIPKGEDMVLVPSTKSVGSDTFYEPVKMHPDCFGPVFEKAIEDAAAKAEGKLTEAEARDKVLSGG